MNTDINGNELTIGATVVFPTHKHFALLRIGVIESIDPRSNTTFTLYNVKCNQTQRISFRTKSQLVVIK